MMNNKGQTLVIFIVFLPLLLIILASIVDIGFVYYEKNKLDNLNIMVIDYGISHLDDDKLTEKIENLIKKNDKKIKLKSIELESNKLELTLSKKIKSTFGKIIGINKYNITSKYIGTNIEYKKSIKKG